MVKQKDTLPTNKLDIIVSELKYTPCSFSDNLQIGSRSDKPVGISHTVIPFL